MRLRHTFAEYTKRNRILKELGYASYRAYLQSPLWKRIRTDVMDVCGRKCEMCGKKARQVHHDWYSVQNLKGDTLDGMMGTCGECHKGVEFHRDGTKASPGSVRGHVRSRQGQPSKKRKKATKRRRKVLSAMRRDRDIHERMCDR
mgnify:CR=1 FL=1